MPEKLSNSELLAILLGTGVKGVNVIELSNKILKKFSSEGLATANFAELKILLAWAQPRHMKSPLVLNWGADYLKTKVCFAFVSSRGVARIKRSPGFKKEHFVVFYLDTRNQEIKRDIISFGTLNANLVHPREVFEPAIIHSAAQIIVAHNHPSGNPEPSEEDIEITKRLVEAGKILGIELLDHIVVTKSGFNSLKELGFVIKFDIF